MLQQLTITTTDKITLKPLVESAIENEKRMLALGIERTRKRLAEFEQQFGMFSAENGMGCCRIMEGCEESVEDASR